MKNPKCTFCEALMSRCSMTSGMFRCNNHEYDVIVIDSSTWIVNKEYPTNSKFHFKLPDLYYDYSTAVMTNIPTRIYSTPEEYMNYIKMYLLFK